MNKDELEWRKSSLRDIFLYYSQIYNDRQAANMNYTDDINNAIKQIDVVLDWYLELIKKKEN